MLLTKEVEIKLTSNTIKHYENLGYEIPKVKDSHYRLVVSRGTKIIVKVEDLLNRSAIKVDVKCDGCNKIIKNVSWGNYQNYVKEHEKYYCNKCAKNNYKKWISFEDWCIKNGHKYMLDRWDYELNDYNPSEITYGTNIKYYFKCPRNIHKSELKSISHFTSRMDSLKCNQCNSFAQWGIDNLGEDFLEKYWDWERNIINPWEIPKNYKIDKIYIFCQEKDYHSSYSTLCYSFVNGVRCGYCNNKIIHQLDSLGTLYPEVLEIWSDKNKKSPYEYAPFSGRRAWFKCAERIHKDYYRYISDSNKYGFKCPKCNIPKGEDRIDNVLDKYNFIFITQYIFDSCKYISQLRFDFYLPDYNVCIEYQGLQHYEPVDFAGRGEKWAKEQFKINKIKDQIKRDFCKTNNIKLIEIPYWDFNNIESILQKELNLLEVMPIVC